MKINIKEIQDINEIEIEVICPRISPKVLDIVGLIKDLDKKDNVQAYNGKLVSFISVDDIYRIYSENRIIYLETKTDKYTIKDTLKSLEEKLTNSFARISNSEIVNVKKIKNLDLSSSGTIKINFINGKNTYVSRRYIKNIKKKLDL